MGRSQYLGKCPETGFPVHIWEEYKHPKPFFIYRSNKEFIDVFMGQRWRWLPFHLCKPADCLIETFEDAEDIWEKYLTMYANNNWQKEGF